LCSAAFAAWASFDANKRYKTMSANNSHNREVKRSSSAADSLTFTYRSNLYRYWHSKKHRLGSLIGSAAITQEELDNFNKTAGQARIFKGAEEAQVFLSAVDNILEKLYRGNLGTLDFVLTNPDRIKVPQALSSDETLRHSIQNIQLPTSSHPSTRTKDWLTTGLRCGKDAVREYCLSIYRRHNKESESGRISTEFLRVRNKDLSSKQKTGQKEKGFANRGQAEDFAEQLDGLVKLFFKLDVLVEASDVNAAKKMLESPTKYLQKAIPKIEESKIDALKFLVAVGAKLDEIVDAVVKNDSLTSKATWLKRLVQLGADPNNVWRAASEAGILDGDESLSNFLKQHGASPSQSSQSSASTSSPSHFSSSASTGQPKSTTTDSVRKNLNRVTNALSTPIGDKRKSEAERKREDEEGEATYAAMVGEDNPEGSDQENETESKRVTPSKTTPDTSPIPGGVSGLNTLTAEQQQQHDMHAYYSALFGACENGKLIKEKFKQLRTRVKESKEFPLATPFSSFKEAKSFVKRVFDCCEALEGSSVAEEFIDIDEDHKAVSSVFSEPPDKLSVGAMLSNPSAALMFLLLKYQKHQQRTSDLEPPLELIEFLTRIGADINKVHNLKESVAKCPIDVALVIGNAGLVQRLLFLGAKFTSDSMGLAKNDDVSRFILNQSETAPAQQEGGLCSSISSSVNASDGATETKGSRTSSVSTFTSANEHTSVSLSSAGTGLPADNKKETPAESELPAGDGEEASLTTPSTESSSFITTTSPLSSSSSSRAAGVSLSPKDTAELEKLARLYNELVTEPTEHKVTPDEIRQRPSEVLRFIRSKGKSVNADSLKVLVISSVPAALGQIARDACGSALNQGILDEPFLGFLIDKHPPLLNSVVTLSAGKETYLFDLIRSKLEAEPTKKQAILALLQRKANEQCTPLLSGPVPLKPEEQDELVEERPSSKTGYGSEEEGSRSGSGSEADESPTGTPEPTERRHLLKRQPTSGGVPSIPRTFQNNLSFTAGTVPILPSISSSNSSMSHTLVSPAGRRPLLPEEKLAEDGKRLSSRDRRPSVLGNQPKQPLASSSSVSHSTGEAQSPDNELAPAPFPRRVTEENADLAISKAMWELERGVKKGEERAVIQALNTLEDKWKDLAKPGFSPLAVFLNTYLTDDGDLLLHKAVEKGNVPVIKALLQKEASLSEVNGYGETPLFNVVTDKQARIDILQAAREKLGEKEFVKSLIRKNDAKFSLLHTAAGYGHLEVVKFLLQNADFNINDVVNITRNTALHLAAQNKHLEVVDYLLKLPNTNININAVNNEKKTLLHFAAANGDLGLVTLLLGKGANITLADSYGNTPLHLAVKGASPSDTSVILDLYEKNPQALFTPNDEDKTPLHLAIEKGSPLHFNALWNELSKDDKEAYSVALYEFAQKVPAQNNTILKTLKSSRPLMRFLKSPKTPQSRAKSPQERTPESKEDRSPAEVTSPSPEPTLVSSVVEDTSPAVSPAVLPQAGVRNRAIEAIVDAYWEDIISAVERQDTVAFLQGCYRLTCEVYSWPQFKGRTANELVVPGAWKDRTRGKDLYRMYIHLFRARLNQGYNKNISTHDNTAIGKAEDPSGAAKGKEDPNGPIKKWVKGLADIEGGGGVNIRITLPTGG
jgi:ankyrin repeat protein